MARVKDGYFLTAAHYPQVHHLTGEGYHDPNPKNGRALCVLCHAVEEVVRENLGGAKLLLQFGVYHIDAVRDGDKAQWYPRLEDITNYLEVHSEKLKYYLSQYRASA